jgi:endonuclease/exonuclease/phosphatase family metal-dependent hydrolase
VRVLIWNLFHGRSLPGAGRDLEHEFATLIAGWDWDVALLQEVPPWWPPSLARAAGAEERTALTSRNALLPLRRAAARRWPDLMRSNGGGANAILARAPIAAHRAVRLRRLPERRILQVARLGDEVCVANLHASTVPLLAREELARAFALALDWAADAPLVFGGDLNLRDPQAPRPEIAHVAARDVDHLFVRGLGAEGEVVRPERTLPGGEAMSDHLPLLVGLR